MPGFSSHGRQFLLGVTSNPLCKGIWPPLWELACGHGGGFKLWRFIDLPDDPGQCGIPAPCGCLLNE